MSKLAFDYYIDVEKSTPCFKSVLERLGKLVYPRSIYKFHVEKLSLGHLVYFCKVRKHDSKIYHALFNVSFDVYQKGSCYRVREPLALHVEYSTDKLWKIKNYLYDKMHVQKRDRGI